MSTSSRFYQNISEEHYSTLLSESNPAGTTNFAQNEYMHSLPVSMGVPTVGFWMTIPSGTIHLSGLVEVEKLDQNANAVREVA